MIDTSKNIFLEFSSVKTVFAIIFKFLKVKHNNNFNKTTQKIVKKIISARIELFLGGDIKNTSRYIFY